METQKGAPLGWALAALKALTRVEVSDSDKYTSLFFGRISEQEKGL
jgi:hypothetical protein